MSPLDLAKAFDTSRTVSSVRPAMLAFLLDQPSEEIVRLVFGDAAGTASAVRRGDIDKAIKALAAERSPLTLIVDISAVQLPVSKVEQLAEVCEPGVHLVVVGDRDEIGLYRDLLQAGVSDYVVKPLTREHLRRAVDPSDHNARGQIKQKLGKLVVLTGTRGGVGTTTLAAGLAWYLSDRLGRRVALLDLDLQTGDCGLLLDVKSATGLREALENPHRIDDRLLERTMIPCGPNLFVLSAEEDLRDIIQVSPQAAETLIATLQSQFHYVIVEVPRTPTAAGRHVLNLAPTRVLVADETLRSLREIIRLRQLLGDQNGQHADLLVINRSGERQPGFVPRDEFVRAVKMQPTAIIPFESHRPTRFITNGSGPDVILAGKIRAAIETLAAEISGRGIVRAWWRRMLRRGSR